MLARKDLASAFVEKCGVVDPYFRDCKEVEEAFRVRNFQKAKAKLFKIMMRLAEDRDDVVDDEGDGFIERVVPEGVPAVVFWGEKVKQLYVASPKLAFRLAYECQNAIEDRLLFCEDIQVGVYASIVATAKKYVELDPDHRDVACEALKNVMMRVSEFQASAATEPLFEAAADEFMTIMMLYSPSEQYNHVEGLSVWLNSREVKSQLLQEFVGDIMKLAQKYDNGVWYIPEIDDGETPQPLHRPTHLTLVHNSPV